MPAAASQGGHSRLLNFGAAAVHAVPCTVCSPGKRNNSHSHSPDAFTASSSAVVDASLPRRRKQTKPNRGGAPGTSSNLSSSRTCQHVHAFHGQKAGHSRPARDAIYAFKHSIENAARALYGQAASPSEQRSASAAGGGASDGAAPRLHTANRHAKESRSWQWGIGRRQAG